MANLGTLTVDLIAKIGGFVEGLSKAERESKKFRAGVEKNLKAAGAAFVALGVAGVAATAALIKSSIDNADALLEQSQAYGVNIKELSAYQFGAEKAGVSSNELAVGLGKLARSIDDDADAFKRLAISTKDSDGALKSSTQILEEIAGRFASMPDGPTKTALAMDLLGKSGAKLIPFLNQGTAGLAGMREEAERLGLVISQETAEAADQFNDNLATMKGVIKGTGNEIATSLLPQMVEFSNLISDPEVQQGLKEIVQGLADLTIAAVKFAAEIPNIVGFMRELSGFNSDNINGLNKSLEQVQKKISMFDDEDRHGEFFENLVKEEESVLAAIKRVEDAYVNRQNAPAAPATNPAAPTVFNPLSEDDVASDTSAADAWKKAMDEQLDAAEKSMQALQDIEDARLSLNEGMEREIALYGETSQAAILRYDIEHGQLAALSEPNKAYSLALAEQLDLKKKLADQAANDEQFAGMEAGLEKQIALLGNVSAAAELVYDIDHGGYEQFSEDQQAKLVLLAEELEAREAMQAEIDEAAKAQKKIMEELVRNKQNILADFLKGSFDDGLKGAADRFKQMLADLAAEAVAADIMKFVVGSFGGGKAGAGGGTGSTIGSVISAFAGMFDSGGNIGAGQWGIAGEFGPEIVRGPAHITSRADTAAMMGKSNTNNVTFNFSGITNKQEAQQAASVAARQWNRMTAAAGRMG